MANGNQQLPESLMKLNNGALAIKNGSSKLMGRQSELTKGIALIEQKKELNQVLNSIENKNNNELTTAFNKTSLVSAIFLVHG